MSRRTAKLDLRLTPEDERMLQTAPATSRRSVSDFVLERALARAEETLADRTRFVWNAEQWKAFLAALDAPPRELPRLKRLFQEPSVFEHGAPGGPGRSGSRNSGATMPPRASTAGARR